MLLQYRYLAYTVWPAVAYTVFWSKPVSTPPPPPEKYISPNSARLIFYYHLKFFLLFRPLCFHTLSSLLSHLFLFFYFPFCFFSSPASNLPSFITKTTNPPCSNVDGTIVHLVSGQIYFYVFPTWLAMPRTLTYLKLRHGNVNFAVGNQCF
jgi:hypothetical protein